MVGVYGAGVVTLSQDEQRRSTLERYAQSHVHHEGWPRGERDFPFVRRFTRRRVDRNHLGRREPADQMDTLDRTFPTLHGSRWHPVSSGGRDTSGLLGRWFRRSLDRL